MRILFFSTAFPQPQDPGRAPYNLHRCAALSLAHDVRVMTPRRWQEARAAADSGSRTREAEERFGVEYPTFYYLPRFFLGAHGAALWWSCRRAAARMFETFRPDVVLSYWTYPDGAAALRIAQAARVPAVAIVGGSDVLLAPEGSPTRRRVRRVLTGMDAILTVSENLRSAIEALGVDRNRIHLVPPAVDAARFNPADRTGARAQLGFASQDKVVLWVGRMVPVKGLDVLLDACALSVRGGDRMTLCLVGDGPLRKALEERAAALGLSDHVRFAGTVPQSELPTWYRAASVTVLPSLSEGTPNVLLESLACGTPFIASDVGGVRELAGLEGAVLVPAQNAAALAEAIAASPAEVPSMQVKVRSWADAAAVMGVVLESVVRDHRAGRRVKSGESFPVGESQPFAHDATRN